MFPPSNVCRDVLGQLRKWQAIIKQCQKMGRDPLQSVELNFRFVGAPGGLSMVGRRRGAGREGEEP